MNVVEQGKLIAFCKVFQHHSSLFPIISYYLTTFNNILPHSTTFHNIQHHSPSSLIILHHSTTFFPHSPTFFLILQHSSLFSIIQQHSTPFSIISYISTTSYNISHTSTSFDKTTIFFYNIFRQHFFSTSFDNNFVNLIFRQKIFVICCQIKKLSFAVLSICYYHYLIINLLLCF